MRPESENRLKFIRRSVWLLVLVTISVLTLSGYLLYQGFKPDFIRAHENRFVCGTCEDLKSKRTPQSSLQSNIFKAQCSSCHTVTDKNATGLGLRGALDRIPGGEWKYFFMRNEDSLISVGDPYTLSLRSKYPLGKWHHDYDTLTDQEIDGLLAITRH